MLAGYGDPLSLLDKDGVDFIVAQEVVRLANEIRIKDMEHQAKLIAITIVNQLAKSMKAGG